MGGDQRAAEERGRHIVGRVLRAGLVVASLLMVAGVLGKALTTDASTPALELRRLLTPPTAADGLLSGGVLVLAATPFVRVLVLAAVWARIRDWRFVITAGVVLALLVAATLLGGG